METSRRVMELLNDYLTAELTALNIYFGHSKMYAHWGYPRLAEKHREFALSEMRDAEATVERILYLEGVPNLQRLGQVVLGETPVEALEIGVRIEREALRFLNEAIGACLEEGDRGTGEFFADKVEDEEEHLDWLETQLQTIRQIGEALYLAQQVRE